MKGERKTYSWKASAVETSKAYAIKYACHRREIDGPIASRWDAQSGGAKSMDGGGCSAGGPAEEAEVEDGRRRLQQKSRAGGGLRWEFWCQVRARGED